MTEESPEVTTSQIAAQVAEKFGPAVTKAFKEGDSSDFRALFTPGIVEVVLQGVNDKEACFTVADDNPEATLDWKTFIDQASAELQDQDYLKTESQCLGVLGPRCIMEQGRFNTKGEVYLEMVAVLTLNVDGLIVAYEAFSEPLLKALTDNATTKE
jgi:hypothetical protein